MEGPTHEKQILVLSMSSRYDHGLAYGISPSPGFPTKRAYRYIDCFLVDLNVKKLVPDYAPSMLQFSTPTSVLFLDNSLYIYGGRCLEGEEACNLELVTHPPKSHQKVFVGGSRLHLEMGWCPIPKPTENSHYPRCITLFNKAYVFGNGELLPEVLDPTLGCWKPLLPLPPVLVGCEVSFFPLPDPSKNRILLYLSGGKLTTPSIYSFTPTDSGTWTAIARDFFDWTNVAAVVDDVIYFNNHHFPGVLRAFDIENGEWLKVHWVSKFEKGGVNMNKARMSFDALLPLGNNILCLAGWSPTQTSDDSGRSLPACSIDFPKFRVERSGSTVNLFPLSSYSFVLPETDEVQRFAAVSKVRLVAERW